MSYAKAIDGETVIHFPPSYATNDAGVIPAPAAAELKGIAGEVRSDFVLRFAVSLLRSATKRRRERKYSEVNRARVELARMLLGRALGEGLTDDPDTALSPLEAIDKALVRQEARSSKKFVALVESTPPDELLDVARSLAKRARQAAGTPELAVVNEARRAVARMCVDRIVAQDLFPRACLDSAIGEFRWGR